MSTEALFVALFFLVPGFFAVQVFRFFLSEEDLSTFELTTWSLIYSVVGLAPLMAFPWSRSVVEYIFSPSSLSPISLFGVCLQLATSTVIAMLVAGIINGPLRGRLVGRSFYRRSWDYLWTQHGGEERYALVETDSELHYGVLYFADGAVVGRDLILANPYNISNRGGDLLQ